MRIAATLLLCLIGGPALAASCDHWTASMEEDEGGPRMMASICTGAGENEHTLLVQCGAEGELNIRFLPAPSISYPPNAGAGDFQADLKFMVDQNDYRHKGQYEDMDGAIAMDVAIKDPLVEAMMTHKDIVLADTDGKLSAVTFKLQNARSALHKVINACGG